MGIVLVDGSVCLDESSREQPSVVPFEAQVGLLMIEMTGSIPGTML